ncbi:MAG: Uncharacterised protein [Cryomorphaceae bacterium]|nr:MAG: Uncharacterised protein [Cryomorphaceae bacterium]
MALINLFLLTLKTMSICTLFKLFLYFMNKIKTPQL